MPTMLSRLVLAALLLGLVPATASAEEKRASRCEPRRARDWTELCGSREGRDEIRDLLRDCRRNRSLAGVETVEQACDILRVGDNAGSCERARRQMFAAALNRASGRLSNSCCVEIGGKQIDFSSALVRHDADCHARRDCDKARDVLAAFNDPARVKHCGKCDGVHHHDGCGCARGDGHDDGHQNQKGKGHEKSKGKGHHKD